MHLDPNHSQKIYLIIPCRKAPLSRKLMHDFLSTRAYSQTAWRIPQSKKPGGRWADTFCTTRKGQDQGWHKVFASSGV